MSNRLVAIDDVLRVLAEAGPLSDERLSRELGLQRLEARLIVLHAHWHGLVRTTDSGEWAITERGLEELSGDGARPNIAAYVQSARASVSALAWRQRLRPGYIARGGVSLALATVVCIAGVAVASSNLPNTIAGPPVHVKRITHHRPRLIRLRGHVLIEATVNLTHRRLERSRVLVTVSHVAQAAPVIRSSGRTRRASSQRLRPRNKVRPRHRVPRQRAGRAGQHR